MRINFVWLLAFGCIALLSAGARSELLTNPGAENGNLTGWSVGGPSTAFVDNGAFDAGINPHSGSFDFVGGSGGTSGASGSLTQNVSVTDIPGISNALIDSGNALAVVSFWEQGLNQAATSDNGFVSLTFRSSSNGSLGTVSSPVIDSHNSAWQQYSGSFAIPAGTLSIDYSMNFVREVGSDLDAFIDDNSLNVVPVPEPDSLLMFGVASMGLFFRVRHLRCK